VQAVVRKAGLALALLVALGSQTAYTQARRWGNSPRLVRFQRYQAARNRRFALSEAGNQDRPQDKRDGKSGGPEGASPKPQGKGRGLAGLPPKWVDRLRDMSPEEQERFMRNNQRFQTLPPQRQAQIRRNLQRWNSLSPTERNAIRDRERRWEQMSPEQRQYVRNVLLPKWEAMPQDRRNLITGRLHVLQGMTPSQQQEALKDPKFLRGLSPDEQSMLRDVFALRNPAEP